MRHDDYTCAFLQHLPSGTYGLPDADLKPLIHELVDFGCVHCERYVLNVAPRSAALYAHMMSPFKIDTFRANVWAAFLCIKTSTMAS
jgi:hypothetical protein